MRLDVIGQKDLPVTIGRYTLTGLLGEGGMARVFRAQMQGDLGFKKPAAVKVVLAAAGAKSEELRRQLIQEARLGGLLNHPNVVQTFDCGELDGFPYIAMEVVDGVDVGQLVEELGPLPPHIALDILIQSCTGLHHAHTATHEGEHLNIIHRDIKPSNVLLRADGVVKVMDFGIAKAAMPDAQATATGMTKGTPSYMSPEQLAAEQLDGRTDLFALGAMLVYMLTGRVLFTGGSLTEVMLRIIQVDQTLENDGTFAALDRKLPGVSVVLRKLLVKDRSARFADALEMRAALKQLAKQLPETPTLAELVEGAFGDQIRQAARDASLTSNPSAGGMEIAATIALEGSGSLAAAGASLAGGEPGGVGPTAAFPAPSSLSAPPAAMQPPSTLISSGERPVADRALGTQSRPIPADAERTRQMAPPPDLDRSSQWELGQATVKSQQRMIMGIGLLLVLLVGALIAVLMMRGGDEQHQEVAEAPKVEPAASAPSPPPPDVVVSEPSQPAAKPKARRGAAAGKARRATPPKPHPHPPKKKHGLKASPPPRIPALAPPPKPVTAPAPALGGSLSVSHKPVRRATLGTTKTILAKVQGPADTEVVLRFGPKGGPFKSLHLKNKGGGRYEGSLKFDASLAGGVEYWIVATHPDTTPPRALAGSPSRPFVVSVY